jgi:hypothetical protein
MSVRSASPFVLAALLCACTADPPSTDAARCTRDDRLLEQKRACRFDEDCPCGAHCALGQCVAACRDDGACPAGSRCDTFGRCRPSSDRSLVASLAPRVEGELSVSPSHIPSLGPSEQRAVRIEAGKRALGAVRVSVEGALEVDCAGGGAFAQECRFDSVPAGETRTFQVRSVAQGALARVRLVRVHAGSTSQTVAVGGSDLAFQAAPPVLGTYTGSARLLESGVDGVATAPETHDLVLPITAEVIGGASKATLALHDPSGTLHPKGTWVGGLSLEPNRTGTVRFPRYQLQSGEITKGTAFEVLVEAPDAVVRAPGETQLAFELTTRFRGALATGAPAATWRIVLERTGELPPDVTLPAIVPDVQPTLDPARGSTPTPWERVLPTSFAPFPAFLSAANEYESIRRAYMGTEAWMDACGRSDLGALGMHFFSWDFGDPTVPTRTHGQITIPGVNTYDATIETLPQRTADELEASPSLVAGVFASAIKNQGRLTNVVFSSFTTGAANLISTLGYLRGGELICALGPTRTFSEPIIVDMPGTGASEIALVPSTPGPASDRCTEMAQRYGCTVQSYNGNSPAWLAIAAGAGTLTHATLGARTFTTRPARYGQEITKVCVLPPTARGCDAALSCYEPPSAPGAQPRSSMQAPLLSPSLRPLSGDLACTSGGRSAASELDENGELPDGDPARLRAADALATCTDDLRAFYESEAPATLAPNGEGLRDLFPKARCFDGPRWINMLGLAATGVVSNDAARRGPLFHRRLQQFFATNTFIAREVVELERLAPVIRKNPVAGRAAPPTIDERLRFSLEAWKVLMHPRFAEAYARLPASVLFSPDYRSAYVPGALASPTGQADGLPVTMLELLRAQLEIADKIAERGQFRDGARALPFAQQVLPYVAFVRALAAAGYQRAVEHGKANGGTPPGWAARYDRADGAVAEVLRRLYAHMDAIRAGRNPLGIEESDTPLYFLADTAGAGKRFSAISDYLLGDASASSNAWASALTRQATAALEAARTAYVQRQDRTLQVTLTSQQQADRNDSVASAYGDRILELCGPIPGQSGGTILDSGIPVDPNLCYVRNELPECRVDIVKYNRLLKTDDVGFQICVMHELKRQVAAGAPIETAGIGFSYPPLDDLARTDCDAGSSWVPDGCAESGGGNCFRCQRSGGSAAVEIPPGAFGSVRASGVSDAMRASAKAACAKRWPAATQRLPSPSAAVSADLVGGTCYKGSLGELALTVASAAQEALAAAQEVQDKSDAYSIAVESCNILDAANKAIIEANESFQKSQSALRAGKLAADIIANTASSVKDCASAVGGDTKFGAASGVACGAAAVEGIAQSVSDGLEFAMEEAQAAHDNLVTKLQLQADVDRCYKDAKLQLVGAKTAAYRAKAAALDLEQAKLQLANLKDQVRQLVSEGRDALDSVRASAVRPAQFDFWIDERLEVFDRKMRLARRASYLAARAVEYELQQSLEVRGAILAAETPYELDAALDTLRAIAGSRRINGRSASDLKIVLSMKEQLLQLQSRESAPAGQHRLTDVERFRMYLQQPRFSVYGADGAYLGQRVPFSIAPLGTLNAGQPGAIAVFARNDCAERLWSVNASIQGKDLYRGGQPTFTRIDLLKSNTFYSQWCSAQGRRDPFQISSVRPSRNLFLEAQLGTDVGQQFGVANESTLFSRARIQATHDVPRADFEQDRYDNGETSELAARGLYGDYALFFPAEILSLPDPKTGERSNGLDLTQVDDILLRLNYVSVAR